MHLQTGPREATGYTPHDPTDLHLPKRNTKTETNMMFDAPVAKRR